MLFSLKHVFDRQVLLTTQAMFCTCNSTTWRVRVMFITARLSQGSYTYSLEEYVITVTHCCRRQQNLPLVLHAKCPLFLTHLNQNFIFWTYYRENVGRDSSVAIATRYGLEGLGIESRWWTRFSTPVQTGSGAHPASYTMGIGFFPGVRWPGRCVVHPNQSSAEVEETVYLSLYSTSELSWSVLGWTVPLSLPYYRHNPQYQTSRQSLQWGPRLYMWKDVETVSRADLTKQVVACCRFSDWTWSV
jgi:hypothetical protein